MSLPLDFHPAVRDEIEDAHDWYEQRQPGLGGDFLDEVQRFLAEITANLAIRQSGNLGSGWSVIAEHALENSPRRSGLAIKALHLTGPA